ncbi:IS701 family transposase [Streptomyces sp. BI20]|uniref:IS701 family transposase n=1 Tax=Streptomyces sp. BI20 TaxID=3403460 RepID=UPI003C789B45
MNTVTIARTAPPALVSNPCPDHPRSMRGSGDRGGVLARDPGAPARQHDAADRLGAELFPGVLKRRDQRENAERYVQGLLTARGRKSIRNVARSAGGSESVQRLHHFISCSPWAWLPLREALARRALLPEVPQAWVLQSLVIPKTGSHSVGVGCRTRPARGQAAGGQHAFGVWLASERFAVPVNWRLSLPSGWLRDDERRRRAGIPEHVVEETVEQSAVASVLELTRRPRLPLLPVVIERYPGIDALSMARALRTHRMPFLLRVADSTPLVPADRRSPGYGARWWHARDIVEAVKGLRRSAGWTDPTAKDAARTSLVVCVPVRLPATDPARRASEPRPDRDLLLLGEWQDPNAPVSRLWLVDTDPTPAGDLLTLTKLGGRVEHDFAEIGEEVGLRDFEGRSYGGWHRHITLASVAHLARVMERRAETGDQAATAGRSTGARSNSATTSGCRTPNQLR